MNERTDERTKERTNQSMNKAHSDIRKKIKWNKDTGHEKGEEDRKKVKSEMPGEKNGDAHFRRWLYLQRAMPQSQSQEKLCDIPSNQTEAKDRTQTFHLALEMRIKNHS